MLQSSVRFAFSIAIATLCHAGVGEAQVASESPPTWFANVHPDLTGFTYAPLARQARIAGTVRLRVGTGVPAITVESGHPLLISTAKENLAKWRFDPPPTESIFVEYVFRLTDEVRVVTHRVPRGDSFDRFFLRIFHQPTFRDEHECQSPGPADMPGPTIEARPERTVRVVVSSGGVCVMPAFYEVRTD
jgi:hypothetical protein